MKTYSRWPIIIKSQIPLHPPCQHWLQCVTVEVSGSSNNKWIQTVLMNAHIYSSALGSNQCYPYAQSLQMVCAIIIAHITRAFWSSLGCFVVFSLMTYTTTTPVLCGTLLKPLNVFRYALHCLFGEGDSEVSCSWRLPVASSPMLLSRCIPGSCGTTYTKSGTSYFEKNHLGCEWGNSPLCFKKDALTMYKIHGE